MIGEPERWARWFIAEHPDVVALYLVGSRAIGTANDDSDFDIVAVVHGGGTLSRLGTGWIDGDVAGRFAGELGQLDLCILATSEFDEHDIAMFTASAIKFWPSDDQTVPTPVPTSPAKKAD